MAEVVKTGLLDLEKELSCSVSPLERDPHGPVKLRTCPACSTLIAEHLTYVS